MAKARLQATVGMNTGPFRRGMATIRRGMGRFKAGVIGPIANLTKRLFQLGTVAVATVVAGLGIMIKKTAEYGDTIGKMAKRTGLSVEELQKLGFAAELAGTNIEDLEKGIKRMASFMADVKDGLTESKRAMDALGLSIEDFDGLSPDETFNKFLVALAGVPNALERSALAQDVFGRAGTKLLPMLTDGAKGLAALKAEADKLGIILSPEDIRNAEEFKDALSRVKAALSGITRAIGATFLPNVNAALAKMKDKIVGARDGIIGAARKISSVITALIAGDDETRTKAIEGLKLVAAGIFEEAASKMGDLLAVVLPPIGTAMGKAFKAAIASPFKTGGDISAARSEVNRKIESGEIPEPKKKGIPFTDLLPGGLRSLARMFTVQDIGGETEKELDIINQNELRETSRSLGAQFDKLNGDVSKLELGKALLNEVADVGEAISNNAREDALNKRSASLKKEVDELGDSAPVAELNRLKEKADSLAGAFSALDDRMKKPVADMPFDEMLIAATEDAIKSATGQAGSMPRVTPGATDASANARGELDKLRKNLSEKLSKVDPPKQVAPKKPLAPAPELKLPGAIELPGAELKLPGAIEFPGGRPQEPDGPAITSLERIGANLIGSVIQKDPAKAIQEQQLGVQKKMVLKQQEAVAVMKAGFGRKGPGVF